MRRLYAMTCFLMWLLMSCHEDEDSTFHSTIGEDNRVFSDHYSDLVGGIFLAGKHICSAFISGSNEITTAAHCIANQPDLSLIYFRKTNGDEVGLESLKLYYPNADLVVISAQVGMRYLKRSTFNSENSLLIASYYESDKITVSTIGAIELHNDFLLHTLDTTPGSSGSPVIQDNMVVGMHLGYLSDRNMNIAIPLDKIEVADIYQYEEVFESEFKVKLPKGPKIKLPDITKDVTFELCGYKVKLPPLEIAACVAASNSGPAALYYACSIKTVVAFDSFIRNCSI